MLEVADVPLYTHVVLIIVCCIFSSAILWLGQHTWCWNLVF